MELATTSAKTIGPSPLNLLQMPPELLVAVFSHLRTMEDLCTVSQVCHLFAQLSRADCLWRPLGCAAWQKEEYVCWKQMYMKWLNATLVEWKALRPSLSKQDGEDNGGKAQEEQQMEEKQVRLSLVGTPGAGKTALMRRFALQDVEYPDPFLNFGERDMQLVGGHDIKSDSSLGFASVWNRYFPGVPHIFLRKKHGLFICYDSTDLASFLNLNQWLANVDDLANECQGYRQAARLLVACKCDRQDECQVSEEMAAEMAVKWGAFAHIRTSAKTKENVEEAIRMLVEATLDPFARLPPNQRPSYLPSLPRLRACSSAQPLSHDMPSGWCQQPSVTRCLCQ